MNAPRRRRALSSIAMLLALTAFFTLPTGPAPAGIVLVQPSTPMVGNDVVLAEFDSLGIITNNNYGYSVGGKVSYMAMPFPAWSAGGLNGETWQDLKADSYTVSNLAAGVSIDSSMPWAGVGGEFKTGPWVGMDQPGYMGFRFTLDGGANYRYGWAEVTLRTGAIEVSRMAFTTADGETLNVGQTSPVPEPSALAMIALGLGALVVRKVRKP